jgi:predicted dehydrogenase
MIDLCRHCVDEIRTVSASLAVHAPVVDPGQPVEPANDSVVLTIETRKGIQGTIHASHVAALGEDGRYLSVYGEQGIIELTVTWSSGARIVLIQPGQPPKALPLPDELASEFDQDKSFVQQTLQVFFEQPVGDRLFIDAILGAGNAQPSFYDGYRAQQVIDAAIASAETGQRMSLQDSLATLP